MNDPPVYTAPSAREYAQKYTYLPTHVSEDSVSESMTTLHELPSAYDESNGAPRSMMRTPSPTPSEYNALNGISEKRSLKDNIIRVVVLLLVLAVVIVIAVLHDQIITALRPATNWLEKQKILGPIIVIIVFLLFGHELVAILVGVTWSLPEAFAITAVGTLLGEIANYFVFRYGCHSRGEKLEKTSLDYGLLAHVVRKHGFPIILVIRFSAIPSHLSTTVFATAGIPFLTYLAAAILSLPKPLVPVYVGYAMKSNGTQSKTIEHIVLVITIAITIGALIWIRRLEALAKPDVIYARRKARQAKLLSSTAYESNERYDA
ncbi:unnamed protein product [Mycena citricolor]|uniref:Golgi apparatus membrane protein TVP38 n=1 Tax=Mycena citricolor TaxID=2018698 RepID=A0AAD2Q5H2_9AGAR|nr:unnamed protein product [Mycena citricolor]CAK5277990.1 unnamed protein product [Mycena citricolor]